MMRISLPNLGLKAGGASSNYSSSVRFGKDGFDITFSKGAINHVVHGYNLFLLRGVQKEFSVPALFARKFRGIPFSILYDFEEDKSYIVTVGIKREVVESIFGGIEGLRMEHLDECLDEEIEPKTLLRYVAFPLPEVMLEYNEAAQRSVPVQSRMYYNPESLADICRALRGNRAKMLVSFIPASEAELEKEREFYEAELRSGRGGRFVSREKKISSLALLSNAIASQFTTTPFKDFSKGAVYEEAGAHEVPKKLDARREHIARTIVAMCNNAKATNDSIFRVVFISYGEKSELLEMHFRSKFPCLKEPVSVSEELTYGIPQRGGDVMSGLFASNFIYFPKGYELVEKSLKDGGAKI